MRKKPFTPGEIALLEQVVSGRGLRNGLRSVSDLLSGRNAAGVSVVGAIQGASLGGPLGAALGAGLPAVGGLARVAQNALSRRAVGKVDEATRQRSPLHAEAKAAAPRQPSSMLGSQAMTALGAGTALRLGVQGQNESNEEFWLRRIREGVI